MGVCSFVLVVANSLLCLVSSLPENSYNYESKINFMLSGPARLYQSRRSLKDVPLFDIRSFPESLPVPVPKKNQISTPYEKIQQGSRQMNDTRVFLNKFGYEPKLVGHQIIYRELLDCIITYLCIETSGGIPIILRGGVGYRYFTAIAKAKPGHQLSGKIRAYCSKKERNKL